MKKYIRKSAAVLTIFDAGKMTKKGRRDIAKWLRQHAEDLLSDGDNYSSLFRGRFQYRK
jgi:triphosphoribosyl-dephospho-CoA synthetase